jgi:hypothetical protein
MMKGERKERGNEREKGSSRRRKKKKKKRPLGWFVVQIGRTTF